MKKEWALGVGLAVLVLVAPAVALAQGSVYTLPPFPTTAQLTAAINAETVALRRGIAEKRHGGFHFAQTIAIQNEESYWEGAWAVAKEQRHAAKESLDATGALALHGEARTLEAESLEQWEKVCDELQADLHSIRKQNDMLMSY